MRPHAPLGRTWAPRGKTPVVATSGQRQSVNAISAVSPLGAFWYKVYTGRLNAGTFREFLKDFLKRRRRCVLLVVDGHPAHRARLIANFVQEQCGRLELHFLPGYAPDLNPHEFVWNHMRHKGVTKSLGEGTSHCALVWKTTWRQSNRIHRLSVRSSKLQV